jgi:hypothetical protein
MVQIGANYQLEFLQKIHFFYGISHILTLVQTQNLCCKENFM